MLINCIGICIAKYDMQHVMYCVSVGLFSLLMLVMRMMNELYENFRRPQRMQTSC